MTEPLTIVANHSYRLYGAVWASGDDALESEWYPTRKIKGESIHTGRFNRESVQINPLWLVLRYHHPKGRVLLVDFAGVAGQRWGLPFRSIEQVRALVQLSDSVTAFESNFQWVAMLDSYREGSRAVGPFYDTE